LGTDFVDFLRCLCRFARIPSEIEGYHLSLARLPDRRTIGRRHGIYAGDERLPKAQASTMSDTLEASPRSVVPCSRVRSTLLVGSLKALRDHGHGERYASIVGPAFYERILTMGAPTWLELAAAQTHYHACDALHLSMDEILRIGAAVAPVAVSGIAVMIRAAKAGGVTPWTVLRNADRYWARMYDGSAAIVTEAGPKDARIEIVAQPLARSTYWRTGCRGVIKTAAGAFAEKAYAREVPSRADDRVVYSLSWV
jgi:hypothetical protein